MLQKYHLDEMQFVRYHLDEMQFVRSFEISLITSDDFQGIVLK